MGEQQTDEDRQLAEDVKSEGSQDLEAWRAAVGRHRERAVPAARQMRTLSVEEAEGLLGSLRESGQLAPVLVLDDGRIVDGVHRSAACELLGIEPATKTVSPVEPDRMAVELNAARRQLSILERAQAAERYCADKDVSLAEAARVWSVAERHISRVRRVIGHGNEELVEELRSGSVSLGAAEERVARIEQDREVEAERRRRVEAAKPLLVDSGGTMPKGRKLVVMTSGAKVGELVGAVEQLLRSGTRNLVLRSGFSSHYGDNEVVAWSAPASVQDQWAWRHKTIHTVGCIDAWKKVLPEWREEQRTERVSRRAANELGLSEGDHPAEEVLAAVERYEGSSVAVRRLAEKLR